MLEDRTGDMKQRYTIVIGLGIGLLMLALVLAGVDLNRVREAFAGADYRFVLPAFALLVVGHFTRAIRWRVLLGGKLPLRHAFSILNISYLFNGALPFRLGEVARIFLAARVDNPIPAFTTLSTILVERLLDLLTVLAMLGMVLVVLPVPDYITATGITLGGGSLVSIAALTVFAARRAWAFGLLAWGQRVLPFLGRWPMEEALGRFLDGLQPLASWRGGLSVVFWSAVSWGFSLLAGYILLYAFFPQSDWTAVLLFIVMASFAVAVPYVPGAVGPYEAGVVVALHLTGFDRPEGAALAFAVILHVTNLGVYTLLGLLGLVQEGVTMGQVARGARELQAASPPGVEQVGTEPLG